MEVDPRRGWSALQDVPYVGRPWVDEARAFVDVLSAVDPDKGHLPLLLAECCPVATIVPQMVQLWLLHVQAQCSAIHAAR